MISAIYAPVSRVHGRRSKLITFSLHCCGHRSYLAVCVVLILEKRIRSAERLQERENVVSGYGKHVSRTGASLNPFIHPLLS